MRASSSIAALAGQNAAVALRVQVGEALRKIELLAVDAHAAVGRAPGLLARGQMPGVDAQQVAHAGAPELQRPGDAPLGGIVDRAPLDGAEDPQQHVVEVHADIHRHAAAPRRVALPRSCVPPPARRDVGQVYVVDLVGRTGRHPLPETLDLGVETQLQDRPHAAARRPLQSDQTVDLLRIDTQRLLADRIGARLQPLRGVRGVEVIGGAHGQIVDRLAAEAAPEGRGVGRKIGIGEVAVHHPHAVRQIVRCDQLVPQGADRLQMTRGDIARHADDRKSFFRFHRFVTATRRPGRSRANRRTKIRKYPLNRAPPG